MVESVTKKISLQERVAALEARAIVILEAKNSHNHSPEQVVGMVNRLKDIELTGSLRSMENKTKCLLRSVAEVWPPGSGHLTPEIQQLMGELLLVCSIIQVKRKNIAVARTSAKNALSILEFLKLDLGISPHYAQVYQPLIDEVRNVLIICDGV